jgi:hypothetical protein
VAVAVTVVTPPTPITLVIGVSVMFATGATTVIVVRPCFPPAAAVICAWPGATAAMTPALLTEATETAEDDHVTVPVAIWAPVWSVPETEAVVVSPGASVDTETATFRVVRTADGFVGPLSPHAVSAPRDARAARKNVAVRGYRPGRRTTVCRRNVFITWSG